MDSKYYGTLGGKRAVRGPGRHVAQRFTVLGHELRRTGYRRAVFRGLSEGSTDPLLFQNGDYRYHSKVNGEFSWFQGSEEIFYRNERIYECTFQGGLVYRGLEEVRLT